MRNKILTAAAGIWAWAAFAGHALGQEVDVETLNAKQLKDLGLSLEALGELKKLGGEKVLPAGAETPFGELLTVGKDGEPRLTTVPSLRSGQILIDTGTIGQLRGRVKADRTLLVSDTLRDQLTTRLAKSIFEQFQSVAPSAVPRAQDLPLQWQSIAAAIGWQGPAQSAPSECAGKRDAFLITGEKILFGDQGDATQPRPDAERARLIQVVRGYDESCLLPVAAKPNPDLPLAHLAIVESAAHQPFCMALHIGGDKFMTARHCFFDRRSGARLVGTVGATLSLADQSVLRVAVSPDVAVGGRASTGYPDDFLVLRASGLPVSVLQRKPLGLAAPSPLQKLSIVGYFAGADPDRLIARQTDTARGSFPLWPTALRQTRETGLGYCRVWDWTGSDADGGCIIHSCQSITGFSGAPLFTLNETNGGGEPAKVWNVVGIHVASATNAGANGCSGFASKRPQDLLNGNGAIAARIRPSVLAAALKIRSNRFALQRNGGRQ